MRHFRAAPTALAAGLAACLLALPAFSAQSTTSGGIAIVNGGITSDEADAMRAEAPRYALQVTLARRGETPGHSDFVADAQLRVVDAKGNVVLDRPDTGPILLANLPPGDYTVEATYNGDTRTQRVHVGGGHANVSFLWP